MSDTPVLEVSGLSVDYILDRGNVRTVDDISFTVSRGEFLGIVGESGCSSRTRSPRAARSRMCSPTPGTPTPSCCCPRYPIRARRCRWPPRPAAASHRRSSTRRPAAGSRWRCPVAIEVPAVIGSGGTVPVPVDPVDPLLRGLIAHVYAYEELALDAAIRGGRTRVYDALLAHPLVGQA